MPNLPNPTRVVSKPLYTRLVGFYSRHPKTPSVLPKTPNPIPLVSAMPNPARQNLATKKRRQETDPTRNESKPKEEEEEEVVFPPSMAAVAAPEEEEEHEEERELIFPNGENTDLCERLLQRYKKSSAPQHRHLCASAAAIRSILQEECLPLTPHAYFAATISAVHDASAADAGTLDTDAVSALSSFFSMILPLLPPGSLSAQKSVDAAAVLVGILRGHHDRLSAATVRSVIKSIGFLAPLCSGEDWCAVELLLKLLLEFSVDRRPKVLGIC